MSQMPRRKLTAEEKEIQRKHNNWLTKTNIMAMRRLKNFHPGEFRQILNEIRMEHPEPE
jgi:DNA-directed RNA polymerase specialized sigma54-like protein